MTDKTAMQILIECMDELSIFPIRQEIKDKANELLELEKQQIIDAMKDFNKWVHYNTEGYNSNEDIWYYFDNTGRYNKTTDELISGYLNQNK